MEVLSKKMTVYEYMELEIPDDASYSYELLNGELVRRNAPSGEHQYAQSKILFHLMQHVLGRKMGMVFSSPTSVILSEFNAFQPDVLVLLMENEDKFDSEWGIRGAPDLIVEIVSPSTFKADRNDKKRLYEKYGVREYWLVDPNYKSIEVFVLNNEEYQLHAFGVGEEKITSVILEGFELNVSDVFAK